MKYLDKMVTLTEDLKTIKQKNQSKFNDIKNSITEINQYWTGPASSSFVTRFYKVADSFDSYNRVLEQYINYLTNLDKNMTDLQEKNSELFNKN